MHGNAAATASNIAASETLFRLGIACQLIGQAAPKQVEAVFFGGHGMRAIGIIQPLEEALGRPVLTSNQVCLWDSLRLAKIPARVVGYGQLLEKFTRG